MWTAADHLIKEGYKGKSYKNIFVITSAFAINSCEMLTKVYWNYKKFHLCYFRLLLDVHTAAFLQAESDKTNLEIAESHLRYGKL